MLPDKVGRGTISPSEILAKRRSYLAKFPAQVIYLTNLDD